MVSTTRYEVNDVNNISIFKGANQIEIAVKDDIGNTHIIILRAHKSIDFKQYNYPTELRVV